MGVRSSYLVRVRLRLRVRVRVRVMVSVRVRSSYLKISRLYSRYGSPA